MTTLRRGGRDRSTVHTASCRYAKDAVPWFWAEGKTRAEVKATEANGLRMCKVCKPLLAMAEVPCGLRGIFTHPATHTPCCSSHMDNLCCYHYRRFHFVEVGNCCAEDARARPEAAK